MMKNKITKKINPKSKITPQGIFDYFGIRVWGLAIILLGFTLVLPCSADKLSTIDSMYYWFSAQQLPEGVVISENKDNFTIEEQSICVLVFLSRGHVNRAEKILNYFYKMQREQEETGQFKGFYRYYQINGEPLSSEILSNTQLWLLTAINEYSITTGSTKYQPLADALAKVLLDMEGPENGICAGWWGTTPLTYFNSADNLLACSVFPKLWRWTEESTYRFAAWRVQRFLNRFMWDDEKKNFRRKMYQNEFDITDSFLAAFVLGPDYTGWNKFTVPSDMYNKILLGLVYTMYERQGEDKILLDDILKNLVWSQKNYGACGLPAVDGGKEIDVFITGWYLLSIKGYNPFKGDKEFWKNKVMLPPAERQFKGEDFEGGKLKLLLAYPQELISEQQCQTIVDWENEDVRGGKGAMKIFFNPHTEAKAPHAEVTRRFLDAQDFSNYANCKVWIKTYTSIRTAERVLKVNVGLVDADGELWVSPDLSLIGTKGFLNSFAFPAGWKKDPSSRGNNIFDFYRISEIKFIVNQINDTPWQIYIDDLSFQ